MVAIDPDHADAWHLLGVIARQVGRHDAAVEYIRRALALHGAEPEAHNNLAGALQVLGRLAEAEASYREAIRLQPNYPQTHENLGKVLLACGRCYPVLGSFWKFRLRWFGCYPDSLE